jgi:hypothetical protein
VEYVGTEIVELDRARNRIERLRDFLMTQMPPDSDAPAEVWFTYLLSMKEILGNINNGLSLVACLLAKHYLMERFALAPFDVAAKSQNARGLDIDIITLTGERIIGEIKTTSPVDPTRFGAQQGTSFRKDFAKLRAQQADHKFMFVTDPYSLEVLRKRHMTELEGVTIVCLWPGDDIED